MTSAYAWRSHFGQRLAELHNVLRDLRLCQSVLSTLLAAESAGTSEQLLVAACVHYRRAFASKRSLTAAELGRLGAADLLLHQQVLATADLAIDHSKDPFDETEVGVITHGNEVQAVSVIPVRKTCRLRDRLEKWSALISRIETAVVLPMLEPAERAILCEARAMGIQLVRHSPIMLDEHCA